jgi:phosphoribosylglycinamide formyltransferase 1
VKSIVIFASGSGSNAENLALTLPHHDITVTRIYTNNPTAGVIQRAHTLGVPITIISKTDWQLGNQGNWFQLLQAESPDLVVLAGFLLKIPPFMVQQFPNKIINLHPSLLPKFGGKGMYGLNVHQRVLEAQVETTGITIHYVNEDYDEGAIIFQAEMYVRPSKSPEELAHRIHELEHFHFPRIITKLLL